jgi:hypothetical protein
MVTLVRRLWIVQSIGLSQEIRHRPFIGDGTTRWRRPPRRSGSRWTTTIVAILAGCLFLAAVQAASANSGVSTFVPKQGDPDSMSAGDFFKLIDKSIKTRFKDMILVIGGCYSAGFSDSAEDSASYKSGSNFALMAATDRQCPRQEAGGSERGNSLVQGIVGGFYPGNNDAQKPDQPGTVTDAMTTAKNRIERDATNKHSDAATPTLITAGGGPNIRLGTGATSYHAILFSGVTLGKPQTCADWNDVSKTFDVLVRSGYDPKDIKVMFGNGKRAADGSPALLGEDMKPASSVANDNQTKSLQCPYDKELDKDGKPTTIKYDEASYAKLKAALEALEKIAAASPTEQYFIWSGSHNTLSANNLISLAPPPQRPYHAAPPNYISTIPPAVPATEQVSWSGGYFGGQLTGSSGDLNSDEFSAATDLRTNHFQDNGSAIGGGINFGYNWQPTGSSFVAGPFASFDYLNQVINHNFPGGTFLGAAGHWVVDVGVKAGVATSPNLYLYGLAGASWINQDLNVNFATPASSNVTTPGFTIGLGGEYHPPSWQLAGHPISMFAQYQHTWWDPAHFDRPASSPAFNYTFGREGDTVKLGLNLHFNPPPAPPSSPMPPSPPYPIKALPMK